MRRPVFMALWPPGTRVKQPEGAVYPKDPHLNEKISLFRGDITKLEVDAIVNAGELVGLVLIYWGKGCLVTDTGGCLPWGEKVDIPEPEKGSNGVFGNVGC